MMTYSILDSQTPELASKEEKRVQAEMPASWIGASVLDDLGKGLDSAATNKSLLLSFLKTDHLLSLFHC